MRCLDASFLIDLLRSVPSAVTKAAELGRLGETLATPASCVAEVLRGANLGSRREARRTEELLAQLDVLPIDLSVAREAALISVECDRRGIAVPLMDCLVAAAARTQHAPLVTRDADFARIPGLLVETY